MGKYSNSLKTRTNDGASGENRRSACADTRWKTDDIGTAVTSDRAAQCSGCHRPALFHCDAVYRCGDGGKSRCRSVGLYWAGLDDTMAFLRTLQLAATGFSVQVAHKIGAGDMQGARAVLRQSLTATLVFSLLLLPPSVWQSAVYCPVWLGATFHPS